MDDGSGLRLFSLGIVVEDKKKGTDYILVSPIETLNIQKPGNIKEYNKVYEGTKEELESKNFITEHESKNYLSAKWLPFGQSNRNTSPDVVKNETVLIFKYGDVDEYYWITIFREPELRRKETVEYVYSNIAKGMAPYDKNTSYWIEVSTDRKYIHLHTSKNDGEFTTFDVKIDTKKGFLNIDDSRGNVINFDSPSNTITINTKNNVIINTKSDTVINAGKKVDVNSPKINLNGDVTVKGYLLAKGGSNLK